MYYLFGWPAGRSLLFTRFLRLEQRTSGEKEHIQLEGTIGRKIAKQKRHRQAAQSNDVYSCACVCVCSVLFKREGWRGYGIAVVVSARVCVVEVTHVFSSKLKIVLYGCACSSLLCVFVCVSLSRCVCFGVHVGQGACRVSLAYFACCCWSLNPARSLSYAPVSVC